MSECLNFFNRGGMGTMMFMGIFLDSIVGCGSVSDWKIIFQSTESKF